MSSSGLNGSEDSEADWAISLHSCSESHPHRRCHNTEDKKENVATEFTAVHVDVLDYCFAQLLERWETCLAVQGKYFEGK